MGKGGAGSLAKGGPAKMAPMLTATIAGRTPKGRPHLAYRYTPLGLRPVPRSSSVWKAAMGSRRTIVAKDELIQLHRELIATDAVIHPPASPQAGNRNAAAPGSCTSAS